MQTNSTPCRVFKDTAELVPSSTVSLRSSFANNLIEAYRLQYRLRQLDPFELQKHTIIVPLGCPSPLEVCVRGGEIHKTIKQRGEIIFGPACLEYQVCLGGERQDELHIEIDPVGLKLLVEQIDLSGSRIELVHRIGVVDRQLEQLGLAYLAESEAGNPSGRIFLDSLGLALTSRLLAAYSVVPVQARNLPGGLSRHQLKRVLEFVEAHLENDCSLETLAQQTGLDIYRFCRAFKASLGIPPHQYLLVKRIEKAKALLKDSHHSITEIGFDVGFKSSSQFAKVFRSRVGLTPTEYRQRVGWVTELWDRQILVPMQWPHAPPAP